MRSGSSSVLMEEAPKEVASVHSGSPILSDVGQPGGWIRRLQPERPVRTVGVVVLDIDPQGTVALSDHPVRLPPLRRSKTTDHGHGRVVRPFLGALP
jgi:hypothetical protein